MNRSAYSLDDVGSLLTFLFYIAAAGWIMWDIACEVTAFLVFWGVFK